MSAVWLLLALGCPAPEPGADTESEEEILDSAEPGFALEKEAFDFCHRAGASAEEALARCDLVQDLPPDRCPGWVATCAGAPPVAARKDPWEELRSGCGGAGSRPEAPGSALAPPPPPPPPASELPSASGCGEAGAAPFALLRWLSAGLVAGVTAALALLVLAHLGLRASSRPPATAPTRASRVIAPLPPPSPRAQPLDDAEAAFRAGDYAGAVLRAREAVWARLRGVGKLARDEHLTDRQLLTGFVGEAEEVDDLRAVVREVERLQWAGRATREGSARRVLDGARRLITRLAPLFLVAVLLGAGGDDRYGPDGDAGLIELYRQRGYQAQWRLRGLGDLGDELDLLVIDLREVEPDAAIWAEIRSWVEDGGVLLAGGEVERGFPELGERVPLAAGAGGEAAPWLSDWMWSPKWSGGPRAGWRDAAGDAWVVAVAPTEPNAAWRAADAPPVLIQSLSLGEGAVIAIADGSLLTNASLIRPENEIFLALAPRVGVWTGLWGELLPERVQLATRAGAAGDGAAQRMLDALRSARLLPFVLQALFWVALAAWWRGRHFGVAPYADRPAETTRARLAEHALALADRWREVEAVEVAGRRTALYWWRRLGSSGLRGAAERSGRSAAEARSFAERVEAVASRSVTLSDEDYLAMMEDLWQFTRRR